MDVVKIKCSRGQTPAVALPYLADTMFASSCPDVNKHAQHALQASCCKTIDLHELWHVYAAVLQSLDVSLKLEVLTDLGSTRCVSDG